MCDDVEEKIRQALSGRCFLTDRFSPGYGDLPLTLQPQLLDALDAARRVGVTVLPSCLMNPVKTVSAVVGIADHPMLARIRGCRYCHMNKSCELRKRGASCEI